MLRIVLAAFTLLACGKGNPSEPPPAPLPSPKPPVDGIELVNPGSEPRRLLRYKPTKGTMTQLEVTSNSHVVMLGRDTKPPTLVLTMEVWIDDVLPDGSAKVRTKVVDAVARERSDATASVAQFAHFVQMYNGAITRHTLSPSGNITGTVVETSKDVPKAMADQAGSVGQGSEQAAMALPDVPVGPGAVWRYRKTISQIGIPSTTETTIELVAIDGDRISVKTTTKATGTNEKPAAQDGSQVDVRDVGGGGSTKVTYDLARVVMTGEISSEFHAVMDGLEYKMSSTRTMAIKN